MFGEQEEACVTEHTGEAGGEEAGGEAVDGLADHGADLNSEERGSHGCSEQRSEVTWPRWSRRSRLLCGARP